MQTPALVTAGILVLLAAAPLVSASHDNVPGDPIIWVLGTMDHPAQPGALTMWRDAHPLQAGGIVPIEVSAVRACQTWGADEPAAVGLTFQAQPVDYTIRFTTIAGVEKVEFIVGVMSTGAFNAVASTLEPLTVSDLGVDVTRAGTVEIPETFVPQGSYIATRICVTFNGDPLSTTTGNAVVAADGGSFWAFTLAPPPNYPTPELSSILMSLTGVVAMAGVAFFRRS